MIHAKLDYVVALALYWFVHLIIIKPLHTISRHMSTRLIWILMFVSVINSVLTTRCQTEFEWWVFWTLMWVLYSWNSSGIINIKPLHTISRIVSIYLAWILIFYSIIDTFLTSRCQSEMEWWLLWIQTQIFYSWSTLTQGIGQAMCECLCSCKLYFVDHVLLQIR
jgi:hypothetical protein